MHCKVLWEMGEVEGLTGNIPRYGPPISECVEVVAQHLPGVCTGFLWFAASIVDMLVGV